MLRILRSLYRTISSDSNVDKPEPKYVTRENVIFSQDYRDGYRRRWINEIK